MKFSFTPNESVREVNPDFCPPPSVRTCSGKRYIVLEILNSKNGYETPTMADAGLLDLFDGKRGDCINIISMSGLLLSKENARAEAKNMLMSRLEKLSELISNPEYKLSTKEYEIDLVVFYRDTSLLAYDKWLYFYKIIEIDID